jgi:Protein of unknown function (DUF1479).
METMTSISERKTNRAEGLIASAFTSLSNQSIELPDRFIDLKRELLRENEVAILDGWKRLLDRAAANKLAHWYSEMIPEIQFSSIEAIMGAFLKVPSER